MTTLDRVILHTGTLLASVVLLGLAYRRRSGRCVSFVLYLLSVALPSLLAGLWPQRFFTWATWTSAELAQAAFALASALEIAWRTLDGLAAAAHVTRRLILIVLLVTAAFTWMAPSQPIVQITSATAREHTAAYVAVALLPRLTYGTAALFTALLAVLTFYLLPVDPLHKAIMVGFSLYLVLFSVLFISILSEATRATYSRVNSFAYLALLAGWAYAAWRIEPPPPAPEAVVRRLWPWR
jgi:hypothetical protein